MLGDSSLVKQVSFIDFIHYFCQHNILRQNKFLHNILSSGALLLLLQCTINMGDSILQCRPGPLRMALLLNNFGFSKVITT